MIGEDCKRDCEVRSIDIEYGLLILEMVMQVDLRSRMGELEESIDSREDSFILRWEIL